MFPGQGAQHVGMARELYETEPVFRREVDRCCDILRAHLGLDLRDVLFPAPDARAEAEGLLATTLCTQPAVFVIEHALAELWASWGVRPVAVLGHSLGEYVAARVAGVMRLDEALALVALRAKLMHALPEGAMLAVPLAEASLLPLLPPGVSLAAVNGPESCVVSGAPADVAAFEALLAARGVAAKRLRVSRAFHSAMMEPILAEFEVALSRIALRAPEIPLISNLTGRALTPAEATDPKYWTRHLRQPVRFGDGVAALLDDPGLALLEAGPGRTLTALALRQATPGRFVLASLRRPEDETARDAVVAREALARLWLAGLRADWAGVHAPGRRRTALLPTYPFERQRYWIEPPARGLPADDARVRVRGWRRGLPPAPSPAQRWLLVDGSDALAARLRASGHEVEPVRFTSRTEHEVTLARLRQRAWAPTRVAYTGHALEALDALSQDAPLVVVTCGSQDVTGAETLDDAALAGEARARGARVIDVDPLESEDPTRLAAELGADEPLVALRGPHRWIAHDEPAEARGASGPTRPTRTLADLAKATPEEASRAIDDEERALDALRATGEERVVLASSGGALCGVALAAAARARRAGLRWSVVECEAWSRADAAEIAAALATDAPHVILTAPLREDAREGYSRPALAVARVAPRDPVEERLVAVWEEAFGFQGIGVEDDFFELGGHSLLATRIVSRVQEEFEVDVALPSFFEARTVADLALVLEEALLAKLDAMSEDDARRALDTA
jgi:malonyl CoA-acyl carrier protein transacylase/acyl carrier protein